MESINRDQYLNSITSEFVKMATTFKEGNELYREGLIARDKAEIQFIRKGSDSSGVSKLYSERIDTALESLNDSKRADILLEQNKLDRLIHLIEQDKNLSEEQRDISLKELAIARTTLKRELSDKHSLSASISTAFANNLPDIGGLMAGLVSNNPLLMFAGKMVGDVLRERKERKKESLQLAKDVAQETIATQAAEINIDPLVEVQTAQMNNAENEKQKNIEVQREEKQYQEINIDPLVEVQTAQMNNAENEKQKNIEVQREEKQYQEINIDPLVEVQTAQMNNAENEKQKNIEVQREEKQYQENLLDAIQNIGSGSTGLFSSKKDSESGSGGGLSNFLQDAGGIADMAQLFQTRSENKRSTKPSKGKGNLLGKSGVTGLFTGIVPMLSGLASLALPVLGGIAAAYALFEGIKGAFAGWDKAEENFGEDVGLLGKVASAYAGFMGGVFGIFDKITAIFGFETKVGEWVETGITKFYKNLFDIDFIGMFKAVIDFPSKIGDWLATLMEEVFTKIKENDFVKTIGNVLKFFTGKDDNEIEEKEVKTGKRRFFGLMKSKEEREEETQKLIQSRNTRNGNLTDDGIKVLSNPQALSNFETPQKIEQLAKEIELNDKAKNQQDILSAVSNNTFNHINNSSSINLPMTTRQDDAAMTLLNSNSSYNTF